jgi:lipopolysaccharide/colanic/teichoic acid biosynthesis glycosyltransferase
MTAQRICDVFLAVVLLLICLPIMTAACLLIAVELQGAPFVRRDRIAPDGRIVRVFHLRTGSASCRSALARTMCELYIDQIPQLLNVLAGDLSLVSHARTDVSGRSLLAWRER